MKSRNKNATPQIDNAVSRAVNFEVSIADLARRSERRAWMVAMSAVLMSLILAGGYFYMLPLKQKVPYLVMADAYSGTATVARLQQDFNDPFITTSEAVNRSNVAHFVIARESYDVALMDLRDWNTVYTMSSRDVASAYTALHAQTNPDSPARTMGKDRSIRVKILSIVLIGGTPDTAPKGATVRFQRSIFDKTKGETRPLDSKIATLEFSYKPNLKMGDEHRIENPLGFQVTTYRIDNDFAATPPLQPEFLPPQAATETFMNGTSSEGPAGTVLSGGFNEAVAPVDPAAVLENSAQPQAAPSAPAPTNGAGIR